MNSAHPPVSSSSGVRPEYKSGHTAEVSAAPADGFDLDTETLIIGAGACGLIAALAAAQSGQEVLVIEADAVPAGSTALSAGLIPAAGTSLQQQAGIDDCAADFAADIQNKAHGENDLTLVEALSSGSAEVIEWLIQSHDLPVSLVDNFDYPGHSHRRMHGLPTRSGEELINALRAACEKQQIPIICNRRAVILHHEGLCIKGVTVSTAVQGEYETIGCQKLILACNGFGGNRHMVSSYMPEIENGVWFGHSGNQGDAIHWGQKLGASMNHLNAYQGHGNVAHPHGILITWAVITQGGVQVNAEGMRFWNEAQGYSEAARVVLAQTGGTAVTVFDERIAAVARQFEDFKQAEKAGAVTVADNVEVLAEHFSLPVESLNSTLNSVRELVDDGTVDDFGRTFGGAPLRAPYYAVRVTGALFHTQGGLEVDGTGQVRHESGVQFPNLFAGGGAACGVSGRGDSGYLSGNGLLSAVVLGYRAGNAMISVA